jgi:hypothetical protein
VGDVLDFPVRADSFRSTGSGEGRVRDIEGGFSGIAQQSGFGAAGEDITLDPDDGGDVGIPIASGQLAGRIKDGDSAAFVSVTAAVVAVSRGEWRCGCGETLDLLTQGRLVFLDLDDQTDAGCGSDFEQFF